MMDYPTDYFREQRQTSSHAAKEAVGLQLLAAHERHAEAEQVARLTGDEEAEREHHAACVWTFKAYLEETR